ncbi:hypothetical protein PanWU01x14_215120 [Parasponia andersonii]|uniref:Uncharacterized protein n=1 Tax=Parasponia andersonii TaxID=3476 RepID=A0A2P5BS35_PARAD|nr:hypothetical protein PanWU01x14_215120 [Parasponia andersonii]
MWNQVQRDEESYHVLKQPLREGYQGSDFCCQIATGNASRSVSEIFNSYIEKLRRTKNEEAVKQENVEGVEKANHEAETVSSDDDKIGLVEDSPLVQDAVDDHDGLDVEVEHGDASTNGRSSVQDVEQNITQEIEESSATSETRTDVGSKVSPDKVTDTSYLVSRPARTGSLSSYLDFLPWERVRIHSSFNDLLLLSRRYEYGRYFMICNPCTKQWIELPQPHRPVCSSIHT